MKISRIQPPVGYRTGIGSLIGAGLRGFGARGYRDEIFCRQIADYLGIEHVFAVSSGKAALAAVLLALHSRSGRRKVIVPAYTCYSVPSAIAKAGLDVVPCDIAHDSFDYDYDQLRSMVDRDVLCVVSVHLFGIPSDTRRLRRLCEPDGIVVVEDAAQAMGGRSGDQPLGTLGDVGVFSLGRGKNVTCGSGGLIVTNSAEIAATLSHIVRELPVNGTVDAARAWITLLLLSIFISPRLYWFPSGLPFLRLGETIFHADFPMRRLSDFEALLLRDWGALLESLNDARRRAAVFYRTHIAAARGTDAAVAYLRLPLLVSPEQKRRILEDEDGRSVGIGDMYPSSVAGIAQLGGQFRPDGFPRADSVVGSLITLPTHPLVSDADRTKICALLNRVQGQAAPDQTFRAGVGASAAIS